MSETERSGAALWGGRAWVRHHLRRPSLRVTVLLLGLAGGARGQAAACRDYRAGPSQLLVDARGRPVTVESPSAVQIHEGVAFFAKHAAMWESERVFFDTTGLVERVLSGSYILPDSLAGFLLKHDGKAVPIRRPVGMRRMASVVAAPDNQGGAWVAWITEPDSTERRSLWVASYAAGQWSDAVALLSPRSLKPESLALVADATGKPYVSVAGNDGAIPDYITGAVVLTRQRDGHWFSRWIPTKSRGTSGTQVTTRPGMTRVVMSGSSFTRTGSEYADTTGIFTVESTDGGETWSAWKLIAAARDGHTPNWPQLLTSSPDTLHVFWMEILTYNAGVYLARTATSVDGGRTWTARDAYESVPLKAAAAFELRGVPYYIAENWENQLELVELRNNEAPVVNTLPWHETSMPPRAVTMGDNIRRTLVTFVEAVPGAYPNLPQYSGQRLRYAWITPCGRESTP